MRDLGQQVRFGFYGAEVQRIQRDDEEIKVMVRYPKTERAYRAFENRHPRAKWTEIP